MGRRSVSAQQVSGYRFLTRRMEYALVCRDVRMLDDPIRVQSRSLAAGVAITAIVLAVCAVLALLRPHGPLGDDPIVVVRESGAVYVRVGDTVHAALNLASARLIARTPAQPQLVSAAMVADAEHGPMMGIPGAPATLDPVLEADRSAWTVCDGADRGSTLIIGASGEQAAAAPVLVTSRESARTYLVHDGRRAAVDLRDRAVVTALQLDGVVPRSVSRPLLDLLPEQNPVQPDTVAPHGAQVGGVLCVRWRSVGLGQAPDIVVFSTKSVPVESKPVQLASADGAGPNIDAVSVPPGRSVYARASGVAGDGAATGPRHLITGSGVAFGIPDDESADALGLPPAPGDAPWPVLALLPRGPELSIARATVVRDTVAAP
ncbi:type VII secretion protein EccB [Mycobacterium sp. C31M]